jgi:hypothetical protein
MFLQPLLNVLLGMAWVEDVPNFCQVFVRNGSVQPCVAVFVRLAVEVDLIET